jgi:hypothetical protein
MPMNHTASSSSRDSANMYVNKKPGTTVRKESQTTTNAISSLCLSCIGRGVTTELSNYLSIAYSISIIVVSTNAGSTSCGVFGSISCSEGLGARDE